MARLRIACIADGKAQAYLYQTKDGGWGCMLTNRTPASFSYGGIKPEFEAQCAFELEDAGFDHDAITAAIARYSYRHWTYEIQGGA